MSRINDALKKARQDQDKAPVRASVPSLRSAEADHPVRSGPSLVLPAIIIVVLLLGGGLVWFGLGARASAAREATRDLPGKPSVAEPTLGRPPPPKPVGSVPQSVTATTAAPASLPPTDSTPPSVAIQPLVIAAPTPVPAAAASPTLNGIFFNPAKPTAIVNNKLVSPGSRVDEFTVVAITQTTVMLASGTRTNVLSLSE